VALLTKSFSNDEETSLLVISERAPPVGMSPGQTDSRSGAGGLQVTPRRLYVQEDGELDESVKKKVTTSLAVSVVL
jgi:hypothetical protein